MNKIINISLFVIALIVPNFFLAMQQPASLKEQAAATIGKSISKEELAKLKTTLHEDIYNPIAKKALPNIVGSTKANNIWEAVEEIKKLSNETLNSDPELAGQLIEALTDDDKYETDFHKLFIITKESTPNNPILWDQVKDADTIKFSPHSHINFAAKVLDTSGATEWLMQNPQEYAYPIIVPKSRPK